MRTTIRHAVAATLLAVATTAVQAQNWEFKPRLELGYEYNDNYRLDFPGNEIDVSGGLLDATLPLRLVDPVWTAEIAPRVHATYFPDEPEEDSNDYFLGTLFERRTPRSVVGLDGDWSRQDVVRSELLGTDIEGGLGDPESGDAGRVLLRNRSDRLSIQPFWRYDMTQRHRTEAGAHYIDTDFEQNFEGAQRDFTDYGVYAGWGYRVTERSTFIFRGRASRYETAFDSDSYGAELEWRSAYSQTSEIYVRVGGQQVSIDRANAEDKTNVVAGLGGRWTWPTTNLFADLTRTVGPNAAGAVVERNQLRFRAVRAIQPRLSFLAGVRATRDEAIDESTYPTRDYITGEVGFDWRMTRTFSLVGTYHYVWQEYSDEPSDRSSNAITFGIVYEPGRGD